jgi:UDP-N-acetylmuramate dehydrogenase
VKLSLKEELIKTLSDIVSEENIHINEEMSRHTTFRTGGPATLFIQPNSLEELQSVLREIKNAEENYFVLGNGSNILVSDKGFDGVVISLSAFTKIELIGDSKIQAEAGAINSNIAAFARDNSLTGFEFAAGIPGTIGGAMVMNAGAYGGEMKLVTREVKTIDPRGNIVTLDNDAMEFGYRTSFIKGKEYIVISVVLELEPGDKEAITQSMTELALKRKEKQPLEYPSAGSTFKRPEGYFAGKLIDDSGLRGYTVGGACVSEKHCGFVVNKGGATSEDVYKVIQDVKAKVLKDSGVELEPEVILLGEF